MWKKFVLLCLSTLITALSFGSPADLRIIPRPARMEWQNDPFPLSEKITLAAGDNTDREARWLKSALTERGIDVTIRQVRKPAGKGLSLFLSDQLPDEGYRMEITGKRIEITGGSKAGLFYGIQTLLQLIDNRESSDAALPGCTISDAPRYPWRGFMLDEARHFFGKEKVLRIIDLMAYYKLNRFHWHLTDEQGWRIEIGQYPLLATEGGKGSWSTPYAREARYYTREDIREVVAYAAARHITVVPEIDMPGHATAANRAYPYLSGGGTPEHPDFTFNVGKEEVYTFLTNVLREVSALFPSPWIHLGGDEVAFGSKAWESDPWITRLMQEKGFTETKQAERYFILRMEDSLSMLGRRMACWDECVDWQPSAGALIYWWRHDRPAQLKKSLQRGYATVLCPRRPLYLDFIQHADHKWGRVWSGFCPLEDLYAFPDGQLEKWDLTPAELSLVVGMQANLWTERIHTPERLDFMIWPRLCALAESAWSQPSNKSFEEFSLRLNDAYRLFDRLGLYYFDHRQPDRHPEPAGCEKPDLQVPMDFRD